jgi:hypothetical protein
LSFLAERDHRARAYLAHINESFEDAGIFVPVVILAECVQGYPVQDAKLEAFLRSLDPDNASGRFWLTPSPATARRAGALRTDVIGSTSARPSGIDALVVALAEERAHHAAVTILTGDATDIQALVDASGARNVAVEAI